MVIQTTTFHPIQNRMADAVKRSGRPPYSIKLVAVSKGQSIEKILKLAQAGVLDFGENYVQEWKEKRQQLQNQNPSLSAQIRWHFIGHLQSNKAKEVVGHVETIQSVDSLKLAKTISSLAQKSDITQKVFFEVNLAAEETKHGITEKTLLKDLEHFATLPALSWQGLMAIPPAFPDPEKVRPYFAKLKSLLDECNQSGVFSYPLKELSMGMSHDFEIAIEEGATIVRIGTALFGPRS